LGFAILNKPGNMPVHATLSNHAEDVVSAYGKALRASRHAKGNAIHVSVSQRYVGGLETELQGLLPVATHSYFATYHSKFLLDQKKMARTFKCLVCVKNPDSMELLDQFLSSSTVVQHYLDVKSPVPKRFVAKVPKDVKNQRKDWQSCQIRILQIGHESFRAACVRSVYKDSIDKCLAQRLWGADSDTPAEDLGVQYVMELQLEIVGTAHKHQIRGQLAALGFPVVGDITYGGGKCEFHSNKHVWNRMALQCNTVSFPEPIWEDEEDHKKGLVPSERQCVASIHKAWWSEYLAQYEQYHQSF
jgi:23S rRNA-/tRNA-specific pseudouridylate synthase